MKYLKKFEKFSQLNEKNEEKKTKFKEGDFVKYKGGDFPEYNCYGKIIKVGKFIENGKSLYRLDSYFISSDGLMFDSSKHNEQEEISLTKTTNKEFEKLEKQYKEK
jgi:hypothetical protein